MRTESIRAEGQGGRLRWTGPRTPDWNGIMATQVAGLGAMDAKEDAGSARRRRLFRHSRLREASVQSGYSSTWASTSWLGRLDGLLLDRNMIAT